MTAFGGHSTITLGNDPWSQEVLDLLHAGAHYQTLRAWAAGQDPADLRTPYYERLVNVKRTPPEEAARLQANFHKLYEAAPDWPKLAPVKIRGLWQGPIMFRIAGNGKLHSEDGWHRMSILEFLGQPVTGIVIERAPEWAALRDRVLRGHKNDGRLYHAVEHPDLVSASVHHKSRARELRGLVSGSTSVLDLGTHYGHNLYVLRDMITTGVGIERHQFTHQVADLVLARVGMRAIHADAVAYLRNAPRFDIVLAIAILHHIPNLAEALALIRGITNRLVYTLPTSSEAGSQRLPADPHRVIRETLGARETHTSRTSDGRDLKLVEWAA